MPTQKRRTATETPKRLTPIFEVVRRLYLASGNRCAFPQCEEPLMGSDAVLVGEIAHIEDALPDPHHTTRFNPAMTNEQRRAYENLLLMCGTHHTKIDADVATWTVAKLHALKRAHEAIYTAAVDQLRRQVGDITDGVTFKPALNGLAVLDPQGLNEAELADTLKLINEFAARLARIPADARSLLALIVKRGDKYSGWPSTGWHNEFTIPVRFLKSIADCSARDLKQHTEVLAHVGLLRRDDEPFDETPPVWIVGDSLPGIGWALFQELRDLDTPEEPVVQRVLCDLDFSALDRG